MSRPFVVHKYIGLPGDKPCWVATNPETGIMIRGYNSIECAEEEAKALNAAYELGRNHESHDAGRIVRAARAVHAARQDDVCGDAPHSCHVDLNAAIELADAIEQYDAYHGWHEQCHIVRDRVGMVANHAVDEAGESVYFAVRSPDQQHYLDENDGKWKPMPQAMGGWFMSEASARTALHRAMCPPGVEPTKHDWKLACEERTMLADTELRRLTDDELGGRAAPEAVGLEPVDGWDDERSA